MSKELLSGCGSITWEQLEAAAVDAYCEEIPSSLFSDGFLAGLTFVAIPNDGCDMHGKTVREFAINSFRQSVQQMEREHAHEIMKQLVLGGLFK